MKLKKQNNNCTATPSRWGTGPIIKIKIAQWANEFSTDALEEMLSIICNWRSSKKLN